ncbi:MAG: hypothetical protein AB2L21_04900 [Anaerolineaceae bacterium]|jgi:hypothetical protein
MSSVDSGTSKKTPQQDRFSSNIAALIILMIVVAALVVAVISMPDQPPLPAATPAVTQNALEITPTTIADNTANGQTEPPVVNIDGIIIMGGILVLITLAGVLREVLYYRKKNHI